MSNLLKSINLEEMKSQIAYKKKHGFGLRKVSQSVNLSAQDLGKIVSGEGDATKSTN